MKTFFHQLVISILLIISTSTFVFGQKVEDSPIEEKRETKINSISGIDEAEAAGDKILFKDGATKLLEIENLDNNAGRLIFYDAAVSGGGIGTDLINLNGNLIWGGNQLGLASGGVTKIDHLSDAKYDGTSLFFGDGGGSSDDGANSNSGIGAYSLSSNTSGYYNTAMGAYTLHLNTIGHENSAFGYQALRHNNNSVGRNVAVGSEALYFNSTGSGNVAIGFNAGKAEYGSNKLYIENSDISTPLIYGEFDNNLVRINGNFETTGTSTVNGQLHVKSNFGILKLESSTSDGYIEIYNDVGIGSQYIGYFGAYNGINDIDIGTSGSGGNLNLVTGATPRVVVSPSGDVDIKSGELNRSTKTGAANLLPIAFGNVASDGSINSGTTNFTVSWNSTDKRYEITITGESYNLTDYTTMLTCGNLDRTIALDDEGITTGVLIVYSRRLSDLNIGQTPFTFIVYKN